jgi:hypothetical protein
MPCRQAGVSGTGLEAACTPLIVRPPSKAAAVNPRIKSLRLRIMEDANEARDGRMDPGFPERKTRSDGRGFREIYVMNRRKTVRMNASRLSFGVSDLFPKRDQGR